MAHPNRILPCIRIVGECRRVKELAFFAEKIHKLPRRTINVIIEDKKLLRSFGYEKLVMKFFFSLCCCLQTDKHSLNLLSRREIESWNEYFYNTKRKSLSTNQTISPCNLYNNWWRYECWWENVIQEWSLLIIAYLKDEIWNFNEIFIGSHHLWIKKLWKIKFTCIIQSEIFHCWRHWKRCSSLQIFVN